MDIKTVRLKQYNSTYKHVLLIDGEAVCITQSGNRMNECIQYLNGCDVEMNDDAIKKLLDKYRMPFLNQGTKKKKNRKSI